MIYRHYVFFVRSVENPKLQGNVEALQNALAETGLIDSIVQNGPHAGTITIAPVDMPKFRERFDGYVMHKTRKYPVLRDYNGGKAITQAQLDALTLTNIAAGVGINPPKKGAGIA